MLCYARIVVTITRKKEEKKRKDRLRMILFVLDARVFFSSSIISSWHDIRIENSHHSDI